MGVHCAGTMSKIYPGGRAHLSFLSLLLPFSGLLHGLQLRSNRYWHNHIMHHMSLSLVLHLHHKKPHNKEWEANYEQGMCCLVKICLLQRRMQLVQSLKKCFWLSGSKSGSRSTSKCELHFSEL